MPLVRLILLEGYRLGIDLPRREFDRLLCAGARLWASMPAYKAAEVGRSRLMSPGTADGLVVFREVPEYRRLDHDYLSCVTCGYIVALAIRDSYPGPEHPFHHPGCPWWYAEPPADAGVAPIIEG